MKYFLPLLDGVFDKEKSSTNTIDSCPRTETNHYNESASYNHTDETTINNVTVSTCQQHFYCEYCVIQTQTRSNRKTYNKSQNMNVFNFLHYFTLRREIVDVFT